MSSDLSAFSMLDLFRTEVETHCGVLNTGLLSLEKNTGAIDVIESLMRAAHSLKGAARIVQLNSVSTLAHVMEDIFVAVQEGRSKITTSSIDILLEGVDIFTDISKLPENCIEAYVAEKEMVIKTISEKIAKLSSTTQAQLEKKSSEAPGNKQAAISDNPTEPEMKKQSQETLNNVVRVTAETLSSLIVIAGEFIVESSRHEPFLKSMLHRKKADTELHQKFDRLCEAIENGSDHSVVKSILYDLGNCINFSRELLSDNISEFELLSRNMDRLCNRLHREVVKCRMRPFSDGLKGFPRLVRDLAKELGKKVSFITEGDSTPVDRDILDLLEAPLNHILRNAVDHGIELPQERALAGKNEQGVIKLKASHKLGMLSIIVQDDGRGIDFARLREKIVSKNLATVDMAEALSDGELIDFLFLPGFSTARELSEISGRGVGLDVVQNMINEVGGTVKAISEQGKSMFFEMQLPLSLSVIKTLLVEIASDIYAFPLSRIKRCHKVLLSKIELLEDRQYLNLQGRKIGLIDMRQIFQLPGTSCSGEEFAVVEISVDGICYGLIADSFIGESNLVVQPLDRRLGKVKNISSASVMLDGSPVLIIDVEDMARSIENILRSEKPAKLGKHSERTGVKKKKKIVVVDDSITVRETERKLLENRGYKVVTAVNGIDGWNAIRAGVFDLVITDIDMPRMNGFELTKLIKNSSLHKSTPVMVLSYKDRDEDRIKGLEAGADYYLTKNSFQDETFLNAVTDLIGKP